MSEIVRMAKKSGKTAKTKKKKLSFAADLMRRLLLMHPHDYYIFKTYFYDTYYGDY